MAMRGGPRLPVGSAAWVAEERSSALTIAQSEIEEFSFSARNEMDWLNEHMAEIFSENQMCVDLDLSRQFRRLTGIGMSPSFSKHQESYGEGHREQQRRPLPVKPEW